jgi:DNA polymerase-1
MLQKRAASRPQVPQQKARTWQGIAGGIYHLINTLPLWRKFYADLKIKKTVACDVETSGLSSYHGAEIIGFSFSWGAEHSYYVPIRHVTMEKQLDIFQIRDDLLEFFGDPKRVTIWHNGKFDLHFLAKEELIPKHIIHDTRLMHSLIDESGSQKLKLIAKQEIHAEADKWELAVDKFRGEFGRKNKIPKKKVHYGYVPLDIMTPYAASDAHYTWILYKRKLIRVVEDLDLRRLYLSESSLLWVLQDCEYQGVFVDKEYLASVGPILQKQIDELHARIIDELGDVNPSSGATLIKPLLAKGVKLTKKSKKTGRFSLDASVMESMAAKYEVCALIQEYRAATKLKSTYVDSILELLTDDQRLHCDYNQMVTTGRMSSKQPNLQNIPRRDKTIRRAFVPPKELRCEECGHTEQSIIQLNQCPKCWGPVVLEPNYVLAYIDYSQMEVRMTAHYSEDPILIDCYTKPPFRDVHTQTLCQMFGGDYDEATAILNDDTHKLHQELSFKRSVAKTINFLIIYGGTAYTLSLRISTPKKQYSEKTCQGFINQYFAKLSGVRRWIGKTKMQVRDAGYVQNHFGRYRRFPELSKLLRRYSGWGNTGLVERIERQAVNFLIQGTCADLFKVAMVRAHELLRGKKSRLVKPIHDEIVFYMHRSELSYLKGIIEKMEDFDFRVPMTTDLSYSATNWAEKKPLKL